MKRVLSAFCCICMILSLCAPSAAISASDASQHYVSLESFFNQLFTSSTSLYDSNGNDRTSAFLTTYGSLFRQADYEALYSALEDEGIVTIHTISIENPPQNGGRFIAYPTYEKTVWHRIVQDGFPFDQKSWLFGVTASGSFTHHESQGVIVSFPNPTISVSYSGLGTMFSGSLDSMSLTTPVISGNSASFSVTTTHSVSFTIENIPGSLGPFTNVSDFLIEGA